MIRLTGINETEFISPSISKLQDLIRQKGGESVHSKLALAHGLLRKASSLYINETTTQEQLAIVEYAEECLNNFTKSSAESAISSLSFPGDKSNVGLFIIIKDRPFIVDTIREYFIAKNYPISCLLHPIFQLSNGNNVSLSYVEFENQNPRILEQIKEDLIGRLGQLKIITKDFESMLQVVRKDLVQIPTSTCLYDAELPELLRWLAEGAFIFLGLSEWETDTNIQKYSLGIVRDKTSITFSRLSNYLKEDVEVLKNSDSNYLITKVPLRSPIHRPNFMDLVSVKTDENNILSLVGLFTSRTTNQDVGSIPILRHRLSIVLAEEGLIPNSHDYKETVTLADTLPKSDFFQLTDEELRHYFKEVINAQLQEKAGLILVNDIVGRFNYFTTILSRERYSHSVIESIEGILKKGFNSTPQDIETHAVLSDFPLVLIRTVIPQTKGLELVRSIEDLEDEIEEETTSWNERLRQLLSQENEEIKAAKLYSYYSKALDDPYKATHSPEESICDIQMLERLTPQFPLELSLEEHPSFYEVSHYRLRLYKRGESLTLSNIIPFLENAGFHIIRETVSEVATEGAVWAAIYDLFISPKLVPTLDQERASQVLLPALKRILQKEIDNDYLNHLLVNPGLSAQEISILRGLVRYLRQIRIVSSPRIAMESLVLHPEIAKILIRYFYEKFQPGDDTPGLASDKRKLRLKDLDLEILTALKEVHQVSYDKYLRAIWNLLEAIVRTNYFILEKPERIAYKIDPSIILSMPNPRPHREIFVSAPHFQGIHLRGGKVSRGGLRWSSRQEDFRTEVLGLMKTQMVKNSIIVPVGAKGGFVLHNEPTERAELSQAIESTYKDFIRSLLDVTDNRVDGKIITPDKCVYYDEEDSYLVVAADRGTATFSDIANSIAVDEFSFWLGDAFASGGSAGYDHKVLGITAKGAWECALRHFKEIGIDVENQEFTVTGIGDMSGDVFGNGLLRSDNAKLIAAFDHRNIFIDPDPDPKRSFAERLRLYNLPRSSWEDYDTSLLSPGAMIVSRNAKEIKLSPEAQIALGTDKEVFNSSELVQTILKAPVDLLWNGGIGTYIKASNETDLDAQDRSNDDVRVNAKELRVRIIAEGGNLGMTQLARIEYAKVGGHINTDAVDNSAGVDMSDLEVNLKLLFRESVISKELSIEERNDILRSCEDEACDKVLSRNRSQSLVLSLAVRRSRINLNYYEELISSFEKEGRLSASADFLPDEETFEKRRLAKAGLCRPELAILIAHTKMSVFEAILESELPDDPYMKRYLQAYFPRSITERFTSLLDTHPLRREIISTQIANVLVERMGSSFVYRLSIEVGCPITDIIKAFITADTIFNGSELVKNLSVLDKANTCRFYMSALLRVQSALDAISRWFLSDEIRTIPLGKLIDKYRAPFQELLSQTEEILSPGEQNRYQETIRELLIHGVPRELSKSIGAVQYATVYLDIIKVAENARKEPIQIALLYAQLGSELQVGQLIESANNLTSDDKWDNLASKTLSIKLRVSIAKLCENIIAEFDSVDNEIIERYFSSRKALLERYRAAINEITKSTASISSLLILSNLLESLSRPSQEVC